MGPIPYLDCLDLTYLDCFQGFWFCTLWQHN